MNEVNDPFVSFSKRKYYCYIKIYQRLNKLVYEGALNKLACEAIIVNERIVSERLNNI